MLTGTQRSGQVPQCRRNAFTQPQSFYLVCSLSPPRRMVGTEHCRYRPAVAAQSPPSAKSAAGRVEGGSDVLSLGTSATGTIAELLVQAGAHVQAGQHLVRVECTNVERELEARKSDLAAAELFYLRTLHGPRTEEISVGIANVNLADARLQEAEKALRRTQQLHEGFTVTSRAGRQSKSSYGAHTDTLSGPSGGPLFRWLTSSACVAAIRHMKHVDAGHHLEQLAGNMARGPIAG